MSTLACHRSSVRLALPALVLLGLGAPATARADMPGELLDPDDVLPPDYLGSPVTPPPVSPAPITPPPMRAAPVVIRRVVDVPPGGDTACVQLLDHARVPFRRLKRVRGIETPVEVTGPIAGVRLVPRAGRDPVMDCRLALALAELAPVFRRHGVTGLSFSGAYDYRTRRGSSRLSAHAHGLAIDVHALEIRTGIIDVKKDFPRDGARWRGTGGRPDSVAACVGRPARKLARTVRSLACRLKLDPVLRHVLGPDTDADHHDHLHIETYPTGASELIAAARRSTQQARRAPRR